MKASEAREKILAGNRNLERKIIEGGTLNLEDTTIEGSLHLDGTTIKNDLVLRGAIINGHLDLRKTTIKGNLSLWDATIKYNLFLGGTIVKKELNLLTKEGPVIIFVSPKMARLVHWSAPNVPLVVAG